MFAQYLFTFGTSYDICCAYDSSIRANTTLHGEMFNHCLLSCFEERQHVSLFQNLINFRNGQI